MIQFTRVRNEVYLILWGKSKVLFGTLDNEDANYYTDKSSHLQNEQLDFLRLSKEQITVVKTTLRSINSTLLTVTENEVFLKVWNG